MKRYLSRISPQNALTGIIVLALVIRIAMAIGLGNSANPISGANDQVSYDTLAQRVLQGKGFSFPSGWYPFTSANEPTAHWSYLYTLYLAGVYAVVGHHPFVARLIQAIISGLTCWLVYRIGKRLFGEWVGLASAALTAVYGYLIFFNAALMTQTFYILAVLAAIDLALELAKKPTRRNWILLGLVVGLGAPIRQTLVLFTPLLLAAILWANNFRLRWRDAFLSLLVAGLCILPFTIYNYFTFHEFLLLNTNSGFWFYSSNHPNQGTNFNPNYVAPLPAELRGLSEPAIDRALLNLAFQNIAADPRRFILLSINRVKDYFWIMPSGASSLESNLGRIFSFTLYLPMMLYGLFVSRKHWRTCLPLYLYVTFDAGVCLISWAAPRYRLPSDVVMMTFAGYAVVDIASRLGWIPAPTSENIPLNLETNI